MLTTLSRREIRKAYLDVGATLSGTARRLGVTVGAVSQVVNGKRETTRIRRAIAEDLGMTYSRVWGTEDPETGRQSPAASDLLHTYSSDPEAAKAQVA